MYIVTTAIMLLLLLFYTTVLFMVLAQHNLTQFGTTRQSSSFTTGLGKPEYAIYPPISNGFSLSTCSHTYLTDSTASAWWMFQFSSGPVYITDITIYYREGFASRMDGFKLYVTNTSTIPPDGYLCYEDPDPGLPNITQTIPCNQLGQYVIYYDNTGSVEGNVVYGPMVELCYIAINGCQKRFWGSNCQKLCSENCIEQHCYPGNGSCIWGCKADKCLNNICNVNRYTLICTNGCKERRTGSNCDKYNMASDSLVAQTPSGSQPASLANDGDKRSCSKTKGFPLIFQVDLKRESIVQGLYITFGESTTKEGTHTLYASNTNNAWKSGIILYQGNTLPSEINFNAVFRYLTYVPPVKGTFSELEICEIGIIGCPPSYYGLLCNQSCPGNCDGPCNLKTGNCIFGCLNGWTGDQCEQKCLNGHFGRNCSQVCEGCISRTCYPVNGLCNNTTACRPGYLYGEYCNKPCSHGFYGSNCLQTCSPLCLYQPCDRKTGQCIGGCARGLQGFNCTQVSFNKNSPVLLTYIGLSIGCILSGVLLTTVVCFVIMKKRQLRKIQGNENATGKVQSHKQQHYDDVGMEVSTYQDLQKGSKSNNYDQINTTYIKQSI